MGIRRDDGPEYTLPELDVAVIAGSEHEGFQVTEWVEQKQRMVTGICTIPVGKNILLLSVGLADQDRICRKSAFESVVEPFLQSSFLTTPC